MLAAIAYREAAIDFVPLLFLVYVVIVIFSSLVKAARQIAKGATSAGSLQAPQPGTPAQPLFTADQVRAVLERRVAAAAAARAAAMNTQPTPAPVIQPVQPAVSALPAATAASPFDMTTFTLPGESAAPPVDLTTLLQGLPLAAQAVVAAAVIGPCAAHRGGGHNPEDW